MKPRGATPSAVGRLHYDADLAVPISSLEMSEVDPCRLVAARYLSW